MFKMLDFGYVKYVKLADEEIYYIWNYIPQ